MFLPPANEVWGKVIFLHLFVILFTGGVLSQHALQVASQHVLHGGVDAIPACIAGGIPACLPGGSANRRCAPGAVIPRGCLVPGGAWFWAGAWSPGAGVLLLGGCLLETPRTTTAAGGAHPTGMHSCLFLRFNCFIYLDKATTLPPKPTRFDEP